MRHLELNDWLVLNNIIYKIYTIEDETQMRRNFLEQLKMLMDFDSGDFFLAGRSKAETFSNPVLYNCDDSHAGRFPLIDYSREIMLSGKSMVYRETDVIPEEKRQKQAYYTEIYRPNSWNYSLQITIARDKQFLGTASFYRTIGKDNFQYDDIFLLDMLKDHLSYRLHNDYIRAARHDEKLTIREASAQYQLTKREETILSFLMQGIDNVQICDELVISLNTLKKHILNIYRKLGIRSRVQLFKMIREHSD